MAVEATDDMLPGYIVRPLTKKQQNGKTYLVRGGANYAMAHWKNGSWMLGRADIGTNLVLDFEPTHWMRKVAK